MRPAARPARESHALGEIAAQEIVVDHEHPRQPRLSFREDRLHTLHFALGQMTLYGDIAQPRRERAPRDAMRRQRRRDHRAARNRQRWCQVRAEITAVFSVDGVLAKRDERPAPPLHVMIARNHEYRSRLAREIDERAAALQLAVTRAL